MISYRQLTKRDVSQVQKVALAAWLFTYNGIYRPAVVRRYVSRYYAREAFDKRVFPSIKKGNACFNVALEGKRLIGYSHIGKGRDGWELFRIYLLPDYIGRGIGKELLAMGERFLRKNKASSYFLYVHGRNRVGKRFYLRNGFTRVPSKDRFRGTSQFLVKKLSRTRQSSGRTR